LIEDIEEKNNHNTQKIEEGNNNNDTTDKIKIKLYCDGND